MKVLIIGYKGTIGKKLTDYFSTTATVIGASRTGDTTVDIRKSESIEALFQKISNVDAIINVAGEAKWGSFDSLTEEDFYIGIESKLMGQINITRIGLKYLNPNGVITLSTGILADDPVYGTSSAAMVNGGIHSFVQAVALELTDNKRINVVSSGLVEDSAVKYKDYFPGHYPVSMDKMLTGFIRSVEGRDNGKIIRIYN
jgi:NADP-dependent 3-hydroxy acid dehydrogenase YdfG